MRFHASPPTRSVTSQQGFALVGLVVAIFIILLALSVAAPTVARSLRREREVEAVHRANEYVNAIRRYYIKTNTYPGSLEQLDKTNNVRYLRQKYNDPMTGKPDWRLIKVGENKTTVKGFFGQPLAGLNSTGIGGAGTAPSGTGSGSSPNQSFGGATGSTGMASTGAGSSPTGPMGSGSDSSNASSSDAGTAAAGASSTGTTSSPGSGALGSNSASTFSGGGTPFMGVGLPMPGEAIIVVNEKTNYPEWEFLYDPSRRAAESQGEHLWWRHELLPVRPVLDLSPAVNRTNQGTIPNSAERLPEPRTPSSPPQ